MATAFDAVAQSLGNLAASASWTHTPVGVPSSVVVFAVTSQPSTFTGITYGGQALTFINAAQLGGGALRVECWGLANPPAGPQTVVATANGVTLIDGFSVTFTGSGTTFATAFGANNTAASTGSPSVTVAAVQAGSLVAAGVTADSAGAPFTLSGSGTERWNVADGNGLQDLGQTIGGTGNVTPAWTATVGGKEFDICAVEVLAAAGGGGGGGGPVASFSFSVPGAPLTVSFVDTSSGSPTSWAWDFGDGVLASVQNPKHTYTAAGTYPVKLTVTNASGSSAITQLVTVSSGVTVSSTPPPPQQGPNPPIPLGAPGATDLRVTTRKAFVTYKPGRWPRAARPLGNYRPDSGITRRLGGPGK